uniref:Prospero homeobox 1a n=1 Tax=Tetraodon nigroviridis TaxID=99883 RepID=H3CH60_TETNG
MPDHDSAALLTRQTKRRRVDIGVKRTVGSVILARARDTLLDGMNQSHGVDQDGDCSLVAGGDGEKSNVLRKLLKRANSYEDAIMPFPGATIISQLLKSNMAKNGGSDSGFQGSGNLSSGGSEIQAEDGCSNSSRERDSPSDCLSPVGRPSSNHTPHAPPQPLPISSFDLDRLTDEHLRAKRARVENIIRGMSHSRWCGPAAAIPARTPAARNAGEAYRENKRDMQVGARRRRGRTRPAPARMLTPSSAASAPLQKQLRQLQEKFYQIYDSETEEEEENGEADRAREREEDGNLSEDSVRSDGLEEQHRDRQRNGHDDLAEMDPGLFLDRARALLREQALMDAEMEDMDGGEDEDRSAERAGKRRGGRHLAETKQELNCAVSQVVDTVVKGFSSPKPPFAPLPPLTPDSRFGSGVLALSLNGDGSPASAYHASNQRLHCFGDVIVPSPLDVFGGLSGVPTPSDQTEALPLVVRKSGGGENAGLSLSLPPPPPLLHHPSLHPPLAASLGLGPPAFRHPPQKSMMGYPIQGPLGGGDGYPAGPKDHHRSSPDSMDMTRETVSSGRAMASLGGGHLKSSPSQHGPDGLSLSHIKSECGDLQDMSDISPYSSNITQKGLVFFFLGCRKLMFFYTRYPSSNMLKMFFSDVKFNRCITSQLIKWFSNFREFYYIQMEKFARQAINEGVTSAEELAVGRDAELFRALNMHYNKANDFEHTPRRFPDEAQVAFHRFFNLVAA